MGKPRIHRCQNLKPNFAQVPEQSDFTCGYGVYLVAAEHLFFNLYFVFLLIEEATPSTFISLR